MYLFLIAWIELYFLWTFPWQLSFGLVIFYLLWYLDGKEYTGERRWEGFRTLRIWKWITPVDVCKSDVSHLESVAGKRLLVFFNCHTPSSLIWSVGLHGGTIKFANTTHYMVPPIFMWIPVVRDVLLWTGAVTYSLHNERHSKQTVIFDLLDHGRSVAYVPSNFADKMGHDLEANIEARYPVEETLKMLIEGDVQIVPVVVQGEFERYRIIQNSYVKQVQAFFYKYLEYGFPLCYWYRLFSHTRPSPVEVKVGPLMSAKVYTTPQTLREALKSTVSRLMPPPSSLGQAVENKDIKSF